MYYIKGFGGGFNVSDEGAVSRNVDVEWEDFDSKDTKWSYVMSKVCHKPVYPVKLDVQDEKFNHY